MISCINAFCSILGLRWIAKCHLLLVGEVGIERYGEDIWLHTHYLVSKKWGILINRNEVKNLHRIGKNKIIICFNDLRKGSSFNKLLSDKKVDHRPG